MKVSENNLNITANSRIVEQYLRHSVKRVPARRMQSGRPYEVVTTWSDECAKRPRLFKREELAYHVASIIEDSKHALYRLLPLKFDRPVHRGGIIMCVVKRYYLSKENIPKTQNPSRKS